MVICLLISQISSFENCNLICLSLVICLAWSNVAIPDIPWIWQIIFWKRTISTSRNDCFIVWNQSIGEIKLRRFKIRFLYYWEITNCMKTINLIKAGDQWIKYINYIVFKHVYIKRLKLRHSVNALNMPTGIM